MYCALQVTEVIQLIRSIAADAHIAAFQRNSSPFVLSSEVKHGKSLRTCVISYSRLQILYLLGDVAAGFSNRTTN